MIADICYNSSVPLPTFIGTWISDKSKLKQLNIPIVVFAFVLYLIFAAGKFDTIFPFSYEL